MTYIVHNKLLDGPAVQSGQIITEFKKRTLHIDLHEMSLVQNKISDNKILYRGNGYIAQTSADVLTFRLYPNETNNTDFASSFNHLNATKAGELYSNESYYTLSGIAADGAVWKCDQVLPACDWSTNHSHPVVHGSLSTIVVGDLSPHPSKFVLHFFEKADLPVPTSQATFTAAGYQFHVEKSDDSFIVGVNSETVLPDYFDVRVEEALRFLLAQPVAVRALIHPGCVALRSKPANSSEVRLGPPISRGTAAFHEHSWDLLGAYLAFVAREAKETGWHPCTGYLHMAQQASASSLDVWATGLGVAVEGLASLVDVERADGRDTERQQLEQLQKFIVGQIAGHSQFDVFVDRIRGLVRGLTSVRAIDRMKWLADNGGANPALIDAWRSLRNRSVHPIGRDFDIASLDFQKVVDELHSVTTLLYQIVFHLIGYRGPHTDYASHGFPETVYPPLSRTAEAG
ncbi:MAG: hypothetical protein KIT76_01010 [Pseudolabrys sp.]|nr:hypothetical protein [Pseudolabrys sp.]MCW5696136.1 hypothetical protein [Bauldia sp.]